MKQIFFTIIMCKSLCVLSADPQSRNVFFYYPDGTMSFNNTQIHLGPTPMQCLTYDTNQAIIPNYLEFPTNGLQPSIEASCPLLTNVILSTTDQILPIYSQTPNPIIERPKTARSPVDQLIKSIAEQNIQAVQGLLDGNEELIDQVDSNGISPFHAACYYGNLPAVKAIHTVIEKRWFQTKLLEKRTPRGNTPLHAAIMGNHPCVVDHLLRGIGVSCDQTHLRKAVLCKEKEIVSYLITGLGPSSWFDALDQASSKTSAEILFYLGSSMDYESLGWMQKDKIKSALKNMFKNYSVPVACEFIRGFESQKNAPEFPYAEMLSKRDQELVQDYRDHPEAFIEQ